MTVDTTILFAAVLGAAIFLYVLLDGFDLGLGILFPGAPSDRARDTMMATVAPVWDGNETWLVLGGGGLLAGFPLAYAILMPAFYLPVIVMLLALIFRGVAFEFRFKAHKSRFLWDKAFHWGSLVAALMQGAILGAFVDGIEVEDRAFAGGSFDWVTPFSVFTAIAVATGYALLGATWTIWRTRGELQEWAFRIAGRIAVVVVLFMAIVSVWMPVIEPAVAERWFARPNFYYLAPIPAVAVLAALGLNVAIHRRRELAPFLLALLMFATGYAGLAVSLWPYAVPHAVTLQEASADPASQAFLLVGIAVLLPIILGYTAYAYWVFRGKVDPDEGYH